MSAYRLYANPVSPSAVSLGLACIVGYLALQSGTMAAWGAVIIGAGITTGDYYGVMVIPGLLWLFQRRAWWAVGLFGAVWLVDFQTVTALMLVSLGTVMGAQLVRHKQEA